MNKETEKQKFRGSHVAILGNKFKLNGMKHSGTISEVKIKKQRNKNLEEVMWLYLVISLS